MKNNLISLWSASLYAVAGMCLLPLSGFAFGESLSVETFYGAAQKDLLKIYDEKLGKTDIAGVNIIFSKTLQSGIVLPNSQRVVPEFFGMFSVGTGSESVSYTEASNSWRRTIKLDADILTVSALGGADLRWWITDNFSVTGGVKLGLNYTDLTGTLVYRETGYETDRFSVGSNDVGFVYGIGVGGAYKFNKNHSVEFGLDYMSFGTQHKFHAWTDSERVKKQSYVMVSLGYKYTF